MTFLATFLVLSFLGMLNAGYLVYQHSQKKPLLCPLDHDCGVVTESRWANIFVVRNEVLGFVFFAFLLASPFFLDRNLIILAAVGGVLFSLFLITIQLLIIRDYCFYCLLSALITFLLFINSFFV